MKNIALFLSLAAFLVFIPVVSLVLTNQTQDVRSRASEETILPSLPISSPFLRLGVTKDRASKGELMPVYVTAKTDGQPVVEAYIVLTFDPTKVLLEEKHIRNEGAFPTLHIVSVEPGRAVFSLFGDQSAGVAPISFMEETKLAKIFFTVVGERGDVTIRLVRGAEDQTSLFGLRDEDTGEIPDILSSTQDVSFRIQ